MIKECEVLVWNECVMVIDFDNVKVQMPSFGKNKTNSVYVKYENGKYTLSSELEYDKFLKQGKNRQSKLAVCEVNE